MAQSPSSLKLFAECPYKYKARYIQRLYKFEGNVYTKRGELIHALMEEECQQETVPNWPDNELKVREFGRRVLYEDLKLNELVMGGGWDILIEDDRAITKAGLPTGWVTPDAWLRSRVDLALVPQQAEKGVIVDWKTGKTPGDPAQLTINAMCLQHKTGLERWIGSFVYLDQRNITTYEINLTPEDPWVTWVRETMETLYLSHEHNAFPKRPSPKCRWCEVKGACRDA
jgi:RecB family exonuclease